MSQWRHGNTNKGLGQGKFGVFAARESGCHPDTGYPGDCWSLNLNTPVKDHLIRRVLEIAKATGLKGFLWDSFSNLGWWQLDYSNGTMKPQFTEMADVYTKLANAGLYLMPEAITTFSSHSCLGLYGDDPYRGEDLGYSYDTAIHSPHTPDTKQPWDSDILRGKQPIDFLFRCLAHKRAPNLSLSFVPKAERNAGAIVELRALFSAYKQVRHLMHKRTILKNNLGVLWESLNGQERVLFTFTPQQNPGNIIDLISNEKALGHKLAPHRVFRFAQA